MNQLEVLVIHESDDNPERVAKALDYVQKKTGLECKSLSLTYEDVVAFKESHYLREHSQEKFGYVITLGKEAFEKIKDQIKDTSIEVYPLGSTNTWDNELIREKIVGRLEDFLRDFLAHKVEKKIVVAGDKIKNNDVIDINWVVSNIEDVKRFLKLEINKERWHAIFYDKVDNKSIVKLLDATTKQREVIDNPTPVLFDKSSNNDNDKEKILKTLKNNGFNNVILLELNEFVKLFEIMCNFSKDNKVYLEVNKS